MKLKNSLTRKMLLINCICWLVPVLLVIGLFSYVFRLLREKTIDSSMTVLAQVGANIENMVYEAGSAMSLILSSNELEKLLGGEYTGDIRQSVINDIEISGLYHSVMRSFLNIDADLLLVTTDGEVFCSSLVEREEELYDAEFLEEIRKHNGRFCWFSIDQEIYGIYSSVNLYGSGNKALCLGGYARGEKRDAYVILMINEEVFANKFCTSETGTGQRCVIDENGVIVSHSDKEKIGTDLLEDAEKIDEIRSRRVNFLDLPREEACIVTSRISNISWILVEEIPYAEIFSGLLMIRRLFIAIIAVVFVCLFKSLHSLLRQNEKYHGEVLLRQQESARLQYKTLESQLNMHFLFNSLNSLKWLAAAHNASLVAGNIGALTHLLEASVKLKKDKITVREEIQYLKDYIQIMSLRYMGKFQCSFDVDPQMESCLVPKLILQPIVENAFMHGLSVEGGRVEITGRKEGDEIWFRVSDNGKGISPERLRKIRARELLDDQEKFHSFGLYSVDRRIQLAYGEKYRIEINSREGEGTQIILNIPAKEEEEDA